MNVLKRTCFAVWLLILGVGFLSFAHAKGENYVQGELIIKFKADAVQQMVISTQKDVTVTGISEIDALNHQFKAANLRPLYRFGFKHPEIARKYGMDRTYVLTIDETVDQDVASAAYQQLASVEYSQPGKVASIPQMQQAATTYKGGGGANAELVPNDPTYPDQWGLNNTGQAISETGTIVGTPGADINMEAAWDIHTGDNSVILAIIDTGVDYDHPEFAGRTVAGFDFVNDDSDPADDNGHGTSCAGIAAAAGNNGAGVAGVNWNCQIMGVKVLNAFGSGSFADVAEGIEWAADNGANVISLSLGGGFDQATEDAVNYAHDLDVVVVASRGNNNTSAASYPGSYDNAIAVGALSPCNDRKTPTTCDGEFWWGSSFGNDLDVMAPGTRIHTTDITGSGGYDAGDYFSEFNGTSAACPFVAGIAALLRSSEPALTNQQIRDRMNETATDIGAAGFDDQTGWGRVDAAAALDGGGTGLQAPVVSDIADQTITEGGAFATVNLDDFVTDGDNTDAEISWSTSGGSSITVSIDGSNVATITAAAGFIGSETITFTATDPDGQSDSDDATYTVNEDGGGGGDAPVVSGIADQTITGEFVQLNLDDFVDDADNADSEITWTFSGDVNLIIQYRADIRACRISGSAGWEGSETITFTATDPDGNTGSQDATYTVGDGGGGGDPEPPVVSDIPDATITGAFVQIDLNIYVDDPDTDDSAIDWTFSASSNLIIQYRADLNMCRVSAVAGFTGSETITFTATDPDGLSDSDDATFTVNESAAGANSLVNETELQGNFPNPFNPTTTIRYALEASSEVTLKVYNTLGQEVITLVSAQRNAGQHSVVWDGRNAQGEHVASGIYIYRLVAGDYVQTRKLMFNK